MRRRTFAGVVTSVALGASASGQIGTHSGKMEADWEAIWKHRVQAWFQNAKLGIFIHWGLYSVPGWAPTTGELGKVDWSKWFPENPYAEWYLNTLRIEDSPTRKHHVATFGDKVDYYQFATTFNRETAKWDPAQWATLFQKTGARYVVLTTKHHDGFRLWPSAVTNPRRNRVGITASRDLVGDLTSAVRATGMKMGLYYSGGLDWTFKEQPIRSIADLSGTAPRGEDYVRYADAHWTELADRYQPAVMWNDIGYPSRESCCRDSFRTTTIRFPRVTKVRVLGGDAESEWQQRGRDLAISLRTPISGDFAIGVRIAPEPWQVVRG